MEFFGDEVDRVSEIDILTGELKRVLTYAAIYPATHYAVSDEKREQALAEIEREMEERASWFESEHKLLEAQRIRERVKYDLEMLREIGYCSGVENYSRILAGRPAGSTPFTLLDYFPEDFIMFIDESHATIPQVRAMYNGDHARKLSLVEYAEAMPPDTLPTYSIPYLLQILTISATSSVLPGSTMASGLLWGTGCSGVVARFPARMYSELLM